MSQVPSSTQNQANNESQNAQQQLQPQIQIVLYDQFSAQWILHPDYYNLFYQQYLIIQELRETFNKKWKQEQKYLYLKFLSDFQLYLTEYVFKLQIVYFQYYQAYLSSLKLVNPVGAELYQKQLLYLQVVSTGGDLKQLKRLQNAIDPNKTQQVKEVKEKKPVEQHEKVVLRQGDPEINLQKLMSTDWDASKYLSTSFLAKDNVNIVFVGHVDSGKSTLTGNIIIQLKQIDEQELAKARLDSSQNKMDSWAQAGVSDVIPEERADGKTRQYAKLNFSLQKKRFTLFDAPGHKNYVPNMIMGACQADIAVLIISAKDGQFQSGFEKQGQTKQHAMLAKALGVIELIVVVTKMGTVSWNQKRFNLIRDQVTPFLQNSCGFHNVVFIPLDSIDNINVHKRSQTEWYKGPCFLEYLDNVNLPQRKPLGPLRIPVIDKFKDAGNLFIYGKVQSGTVIEDHTVTLLPSRSQLVIREIFNAKDQRMPFAMAGQNVKLRVKGIQQNDINRGDIICNNLNYCQQSSQFKANINILELPQQKKLLSSGYQCIMHMHAIACQAEISKVQAKIDKTNGKKSVATFLKAGEKGICVIKIERAICLQKFEFMPCLGRFTLRDEGKTIGYGEIIGLKPAKALLKEQKEQLLGDKKEVNEIKQQVQNLSINKA